MHCGHAHLINHESACPEHHLSQSFSIRPAVVLANVIAVPHDSISVCGGGCKGGDGGAGDGGGGGGDGWKGAVTAGDGVTKTAVEFAVCDCTLQSTKISSSSSLPGPAAGTAPRIGIPRGRFRWVKRSAIRSLRHD